MTLFQEVTQETLSFVRSLDSKNISKTHIYHHLIDEHPEYLDQTDSSTIKRYITNTLRSNGYWNTSKKMNWFVRRD
jgi:hypothetical protein